MFNPQKLVLYLFFLSFAFVAIGQDIEAKLRFGLPTKRFQSDAIGSIKQNIFSIQSVSDITLVLQTRFALSKRFQFNYLLGVDFGNTRGFWPISGWGDDFRNLENLVYNKQRVSLRWLGLEKRFNLIDEKLWVSGNIVLLSRFYLGNEKQYATDYKTNNEDYIKYRYDFRLYHNKKYDSNPEIDFFDLFLNLESGIQLGGTINDALSWNFNMAYYRNVYNYYNFDQDLIYTKTQIKDDGEEIKIIETYDNAWNQTLDSKKLIQREHYLSMGLGMTYKF